MARADIPAPDRSSGSLSENSQWLAVLLPVLLCCLLLLSSTVNFSSEISAWDIKRIAQLVLFPTAFLLALANSSLRAAFAEQLARIPKFMNLGILLFFVIGIASSVVNSNSVRGLIYSLMDVCLLSFFLVMTLLIASCREVAGRKFDWAVISLITLLGLAVGVQEVTGYFAALSVDLSYRLDIALMHFSHARMYNDLQTLTVPIVGALPFLFPRHRLAAAICIIALGLHWYIILATGARGSLVSLLAAFAIAALINPIARRALLKWQSAGILLGILLFTAMFAGIELSKNAEFSHAAGSNAGEVDAVIGNTASMVAAPPERAESNAFYDLSVGRPLLHTTGRTDLWRAAIGYAYEQPFLGIGPMNFACKGPFGRVGSPHNFVLQVLSEWGIPATLILATFAVFLLRGLYWALRFTPHQVNPESALRALLATAVLAALVHLMVSSLLIAPASQLTAALIGGWLLGISPHKKASRKSLPIAAILGVAALCGALLLPFAYHEIVNMPAYREQLPVGEDGRPRFWQIGRACSGDIG